MKTAEQMHEIRKDASFKMATVEFEDLQKWNEFGKICLETNYLGKKLSKEKKSRLYIQNHQKQKILTLLFFNTHGIWVGFSLSNFFFIILVISIAKI